MTADFQQAARHYVPDRNEKRTGIPVTGRGGPRVSETSKVRLTDDGEVVSLTHRPTFIQINISDTHFYYRLSKPQGRGAVGRLRPSEKSSDLIGNRTHDHPACSIALQPTTPHRDPLRKSYYSYLPQWRLEILNSKLLIILTIYSIREQLHTSKQTYRRRNLADGVNKYIYIYIWGANMCLLPYKWQQWCCVIGYKFLNESPST
jgi:hypothetical protein